MKKNIKKKLSAAMAAITLFSSVSALTCVSSVYAAQTNAPSLAAAKAADSTSASYSIPELNFEKKPLPDKESIKFVENMRLGWNLGNTFDAYDDTGWVDGEMNIETCWTNAPKTSKEMIDTVKAAGFNTIRIPVSWHNHVDGDLNISKQWIDRVQEVVDYAVEDGLYVIINVHHDNDKSNMYPDTAHYESSKKYMTAIWKQVAERFKDYDEKLVFETMNEPRLTGHTNEWWLNYDNPDCIDAIKTINKLNQDCVDTIRATGGNNSQRYIAVPGYDCSVDGATNQYFEVPKDSADDKLIVAVHAYVPYGFALAEKDDPQSVERFDINSDTNDITWAVDTVYDKYISKGIPVYVGEFASLDKNNNLKDRVDWTAYYTAYAASRGIPCCWWDAPGDMMLLERATCTWKFPAIVETLNKYAGSGYAPVINTTVPTSPTTTTTLAPLADGEKLYGKKGNEGTVTFTKAIGDNAFVEIKTGADTGFMNGCLGFSESIDGKNYWVAYVWQTKKSDTISIDMSSPVQIAEIIGTETQEVTDADTIKKLTDKIKTEKSALLQVWYASDKTGKQIDPADSAAESIEVYIPSASADEATSSIETTTTTSTETITTTEEKKDINYGDANCDGKVDLSDAVRIMQAISNPSKYKLNDEESANADCSGGNDGVTNGDALAIQKYCLSLITSLPEEN